MFHFWPLGEDVYQPVEKVRGMAQAIRQNAVSEQSPGGSRCSATSKLVCQQADNLSLILRNLLGTGKPRGGSAALWALWQALQTLAAPLRPIRTATTAFHATTTNFRLSPATPLANPNKPFANANRMAFSTGC